jgi:choline-sulfatase
MDTIRALVDSMPRIPPAIHLGGAFLALLLGCRSADTRSRPNLLLITIDTLRADHCSAYGYHRPTTPHLDELARDGVRFATAYSPTPVTGPSHATLFTSLHPQHHGVLSNGTALPAEPFTVAEILQQAGYETGAIVSAYPLKARFGLSQGFGSYEDDFPAADASLPQANWEGEPLDEAYDRRAGATSDRALAWLARHKSGARPFFLWVHYFDPHSPYDAPGTEGEGILDAYDAEIRYADAEVGRVLAFLDRAGLRATTLVAVTSDHGEGLGQHGHLEHGDAVYEEAVRVPLMLRWPGRVPGGQVSPEQVALIDLVPTLAGLMELSRPPAFQGRDLSAALGGRSAARPPPAPIFLRSELRPEGCNQYAVRQGRWKRLEERCRGELRWTELYDLTLDPGERHDLHREAPAVARELEPLLWRWRRSRTTPAQVRAPADDEAFRALGYH